MKRPTIRYITAPTIDLVYLVFTGADPQPVIGYRRARAWIEDKAGNRVYEEDWFEEAKPGRNDRQ